MIKDTDFINWLANQKKQIAIKCKGSGELYLEQLQEFQGNLKKISEPALIKLVKSILKLGFVAPIFIYNEKEIIDGHGRLKALYFLESQGFKIPLIPIVNILAKNKTEAKKILLTISSQYQEFDMEELSEWISQIGDDIDQIINIKGLDLIQDDFIQEQDNTKEASYKEHFELILQFGNEGDLQEAFEKFKEAGYKCKISIL